jgi:ribosomal protein S17
MELPTEGLQVVMIRKRMDKSMVQVRRWRRFAAALTKYVNAARTMHALVPVQ